MRLPVSLMLCSLVLPALGCHSAYVEAEVRNGTRHPVSLVELDYPSASFGTQTLAPGQDFHYRFKIQGAGELKLLFTDSSRGEQQSRGPQVNEGDEGSLAVTVTDAGVQWDAKLRNRAARR